MGCEYRVNRYPELPCSGDVLRYGDHEVYTYEAEGIPCAGRGDMSVS